MRGSVSVFLPLLVLCLSCGKQGATPDPVDLWVGMSTDSVSARLERAGYSMNASTREPNHIPDSTSQVSGLRLPGVALPGTLTLWFRSGTLHSIYWNRRGHRASSAVDSSSFEQLQKFIQSHYVARPTVSEVKGTNGSIKVARWDSVSTEHLKAHLTCIASGDSTMLLFTAQE